MKSFLEEKLILLNSINKQTTMIYTHILHSKPLGLKVWEILYDKDFKYGYTAVFAV